VKARPGVTRRAKPDGWTRPRIIAPDRVLTRQIALESFKAVSGRRYRRRWRIRPSAMEDRYLIVACTVIIDVPEVVGPCPVALIAKVSLPLYLAFALYS